MVITLFTDASHCPESRTATYAVWAKANGRTVRHCGVLEGRIHSAGHAEVRALANGIFVAVRLLQPEAGSRIIAQSDCQETLNALAGSIKRHGEVRRYVANLLSSAGVAIEYRHVKGHRGTATPRNAVNTWCDRAARRLLRESRGEEVPSHEQV
jgi:ribonuclease HI